MDRPMNSPHAYPCIFGRFSLDGAPLPPLPGGNADATPLFTLPGIADAYSVGRVRGLRSARRAAAAAVLLGEIYGAVEGTQSGGRGGEALLEVGGGDGRLPEDTADVLRRTEGAFVLVQVAEGRGAYEARLVTDRFGFRPLFYSQDGGVLLFASHLSGLLRMRGTLPAPSLPHLLHYYHFGVTPGTATLLEGVHKVPPGRMLTVKPDADDPVTECRYFDPLDLYEPDRYAQAEEAALVGLLSERLARAVERRVEGAGRIALAISGGVDSGLIAQKLKGAGVDFVCYNLAYAGFYDEDDRVARLGKTLGIPVVRLGVTAPEVIASFEMASAVSSEPVAINDAGLWLLAKRARAEGADTVWDGDGADRLFLGMNGHLKYSRVLRFYDLLSRTRLLVPALYTLRSVGHPEVRKLRVVFENWSRGIPPYPERRYAPALRYDARYEREVFALGAEQAWLAFKGRVEAADFGLFFTYLSIAMCPEKFFHAPAELQAPLGLAPVSPYWDEAVVKLALSLPTRLKLRGKTTKYVLRKAAALDGDPSYWMLPKIGLSNATGYLKATPEGRAWLAGRRDQITASDEYAYLREAVGEPDPIQLLPYLLWKEAHSGVAWT